MLDDEAQLPVVGVGDEAPQARAVLLGELADEALLPGNWLRGARVARSGGTVRPIPPRFPASACEVVNFSVCSVPEVRGVVPVPDFPPQILFWLASTLEVRAGPCAVRIG